MSDLYFYTIESLPEFQLVQPDFFQLKKKWNCNHDVQSL